MFEKIKSRFYVYKKLLSSVKPENICISVPILHPKRRLTMFRCSNPVKQIETSSVQRLSHQLLDVQMQL